MSAPPKPVVTPMVFRLSGVSLSREAWLVADHPQEVMQYGRSALSQFLKSNLVVDSDEYMDRMCESIGDKLTKAFGQPYSVDLIDAETNTYADSVMDSINLRVNVRTNLSVTLQ